MQEKGIADSLGKVLPPAALTQSLCPKLGSIMCRSEVELQLESLETEEAQPVFHYIQLLREGKI